MAESTPKSDKPQDKKPVAVAKRQSKPSKNTSPRRIGVVLAILISLVAAGGSGFVVYRVEQQVMPKLDAKNQEITTQMQALAVENDNQSVQLKELEQSLANLMQQGSTSIAELERASLAADEELNRKLEAVIESVSSIYENLNQQSGDWKLNDIAYLLLIGNTQLRVTGSLESVLPIWELADQQLRRNPDPKLLPVSAAVSEEMKLLRSIKPIDIVSISSDLLELSESIENLPLRQSIIEQIDLPVVKPEDAPVVESDQTLVQATFGEIWLDLKSLLRVRKSDESSLLPLSPNLKSFAVENIRLAVFSAQLAAIQGEQQLYANNLAHALRLLEKYFSGNSLDVAKVVGRLKELGQKRVKIEVPDLSNSLQLLRHLLSQRIVS